MTGRSVDEWVGATPDSPVPTRVRARVFARYEGRCYLSGRKITPSDVWDLDHVKPLHLGGENRESNLAPVLRDKHREKTAAENSAKAKADRVRAKWLGLNKPKQKWPSRPFRRETL